MMTPMTKPMTPGPELDAEVERVCYGRQTVFHHGDDETPAGWYVAMTPDEIAALPTPPPNPDEPAWRSPWPYSTEIHYAWMLVDRYRLHPSPWDEKIWIIGNMHDRNSAYYDGESAATAEWGICLLALRIASGHRRGLLPAQPLQPPPPPKPNIWAAQAERDIDAATRILHEALPDDDH